VKLPCPVCDAKTRVLFNRLEDGFMKRRRECENGHRFNTSERLVGPVTLNARVVPLDVHDVALLEEALLREAE